MSFVEVGVQDWLEIQYREFYDFPRMFIVAEDGEQFLFDGSFDDALDDYPEHYQVYLLPRMSLDELAGSWANLPPSGAEWVGRVPTHAVMFDQTRRKYTDANVLRDLVAGRPRR